MPFSSSCKKSIILVATVLTLVTPTLAGFGDFLSSVINTCHHSVCESNTRCPAGYDTLSTTREGCSGFKKKNYCCPAGLGPQCFHTECSREAACPGNYCELDRTRNGCSGFMNKAYCCKTTNLPSCFDTSCPGFSESAKSCPSEYSERRRERGRSAGCDSFAERLTCCLGQTGQTQNSNTYIKQADDSNYEVISETKTVTLEDGTVQTVTSTERRRKSGFNNCESTYATFFKVLLLLPLFAVILNETN